MKSCGGAMLIAPELELETNAEGAATVLYRCS